MMQTVTTIAYHWQIIRRAYKQTALPQKSTVLHSIINQTD